jgi:hypothetical protein
MTTNTINVSVNSFSKTIVNQWKNTSDIDNCSKKEKYTNDELPNYKTSSYNIQLNENILLTKYFNKIKETCKRKKLSKEEQIKYRYRPEALSLDEYDIPGLWYVILKLNSCEDFTEFHDIPEVLLPDLSVINSCLTNEEFIIKKPAK